jgi:hypothetical protein
MRFESDPTRLPELGLSVAVLFKHTFERDERATILCLRVSDSRVRKLGFASRAVRRPGWMADRLWLGRRHS